MKVHRVILSSLFILTCTCIARGQRATTVPALVNNLLGERFQSEASGIALRPPANSRLNRGSMGTPEVATFVNEDKHWIVKLTRVLQDKPLPLTLWKDAPTGIERAGMLEWVIEQLKIDRPGAQIMRQETTRINGNSVGLLAAKFSFGMETDLVQEAVIRASDMQYYILSLTCPAPRIDDVSADPGVQLASDTFNQMLDSVELLDQTNLRKDQEARLLNTRTLFVNIKNADKLREVMQKEQWFRVLRDGKDIGYTYEIEEVAHDLPRQGKVEVQTGPEGVRIGIRSRMMPQVGVQNDTETWLFNTFDAHREAFYTIGYLQDPKTGKTTSGEIGTSQWRQKPIPDAKTEIGGNRGISLTEEYRLEVTKLGPNVSNDPFVRNLPPYYLPQALMQLLPRLVATRGPQSYLFTVWVSEIGQVMFRYIDVDQEREVILGNQRMRAVPVKDHVGLEGAVTIHYISPEGKDLGSVNEETRTTILSVPDARTIEKIWSNANLTRPNAAEK